MATIRARMIIESEQLQKQQNSKYLWHKHANSLATLLLPRDKAIAEADRLAKLATQRGLVEKANLLRSSLECLQARARHVSELVSSLATGRGGIGAGPPTSCSPEKSESAKGLQLE